jgi:hypothetical protein
VKINLSVFEQGPGFLCPRIKFKIQITKRPEAYIHIQMNFIVLSKVLAATDSIRISIHPERRRADLGHLLYF